MALIPSPRITMVVINIATVPLMCAQQWHAGVIISDHVSNKCAYHQRSHNSHHEADKHVFFHQDIHSNLDNTCRRGVCTRNEAVLSVPKCVKEQWIGRIPFRGDGAILNDQHTAAYDKRTVTLTHWGREKWPPFHRRHFQMHFLEWKCMNFAKDFTEFCSSCSN